MKVTAFTRYSRQAASTRQRLLQYIPRLRDAGIDVEHLPLLDDEYVQSLATGRAYPRAKVAKAYFDRWRQMRRARSSDIIWIYVELFPFLPDFIEELAIRGHRIVVDLDDAFFHHYDDSPSAIVRGILGGKLGQLMARATACTCGNEYLRAYAAQHCDHSVILPTVVDTDVYRPVDRGARHKTIGWIGSPTTWKNVRPLLPLLENLCAEQNACFRVVGAGAAAMPDRFPGMELIEWSEQGEVADVQQMDIGIMPLIDSPFERGKSGYKLVQYMACGLPVVASPVGVNRTIVDDGANGYLAASEGDWRRALERLIADSDLRRGMGAHGRQLVEDSYSLNSQAPRLIDLFKSIGP